MPYSVIEYLKDTADKGKQDFFLFRGRQYWQIWLFIAWGVLLGWWLIKPPGGIIPIIAVYIFWFWRCYDIQKTEEEKRKRKTKELY